MHLLFIYFLQFFHNFPNYYKTCMLVLLLHFLNNYAYIFLFTFLQSKINSKNRVKFYCKNMNKLFVNIIEKYSLFCENYFNKEVFFRTLYVWHHGKYICICNI